MCLEYCGREFPDNFFNVSEAVSLLMDLDVVLINRMEELESKHSHAKILTEYETAQTLRERIKTYLRK